MSTTTSHVVRCERNEAERIARTEHDARQTADRCTCGGTHTIRPSSVTWVAGTF